jgi:hypothetical protein
MSMERGSSTSNPIIGFIIGCACLAGGWYVTERIGKPARAQAAASATWPATDGKITHSELKRDDRRDKKAMYSMDVRYDYVLDGRTLEGNRVWFGDQFSTTDSSAFREAVNRYPVGTAVRVHYDPAEPGVSALEPGPTWSASIWYLVGIGLMVFGGLALLTSGGFLVIILAMLFGAFGSSDGSHGGDNNPSRDFGRAPLPSADRRKPGQSPDDHDDGIEIV